MRSGVALGLVVALHARGVGAEVEPVRLAWIRGEGAEGCPSEAQIAKRVEQRLGKGAFLDGAALIVEGSIARDGAGWATVIRVRDATSGAQVGLRELSSPAADCEAIAEAATLAIALVIDPEASLGPTPGPMPEVVTPPEPTPCPAQRAAPTVCPPPLPSVTAESDRRVATLTARLVGAIGILPRAAVGVGLGGDVRLAERWHVTTHITMFPEVNTADDAFAFGITSGGIGGCGDPLAGPMVQLSGCAGIELGALHGVVFSLDPVDPGQALWLAASAGPRLTLTPWRWLALEASVEGVVPIRRPSFHLRTPVEAVFEPSVVAGRAFFGAGVSIP